MKPGRKPHLIDGERLRRVTLTLDPQTLRLLRVVGRGNLSEGARAAARAAYEQYLRQPER